VHPRMDMGCRLVSMRSIWIMKPFFAVVMLLVVGGSSVRADEPWLLFDGCHWRLPRLCELWRQRLGWCPNDYCCKTLPSVPRNPCGCVDDYDCKTLPAVPPIACGCVDDYCPNACPLFLGRLCEPWYRCCPSAQPCGGCVSPPR
jgi:hypothetical protein